VKTFNNLPGIVALGVMLASTACSATPASTQKRLSIIPKVDMGVNLDLMGLQGNQRNQVSVVPGNKDEKLHHNSAAMMKECMGLNTAE
jgi:hypothetical protein